MPIADAIEIAGQLLRRLAVPAPPAARPFPTELAEVRADLRAGWERVGRPFAEALMDRAWAIIDEAPPLDAPMLVNTDLHYGNVLRATREPWLVIDPKVVAGEIEYGLAPLLWSRFEAIGGAGGFARRLMTLIGVAGLDPQRAHRWALVRILECWVWSLGAGFTEDPARCSRLVEWLLAHERQSFRPTNPKRD